MFVLLCYDANRRDEHGSPDQRTTVAVKTEEGSLQLSDLQERLDELLPLLRAAGTDLADVEVKKASGGFPRSVLESVSSFANGSGGLVILGLDEPMFMPTGADAPHLAEVLASQCSDNLEPPIRPRIELCRVDGQQVVVADIPELEARLKPCYVSVKNETPTAYLRTHDGDRKLTPYEHHALDALLHPPIDDETPVPGTDISDLDADLVAEVLRRLRSDRAPVYRTSDDRECLRLVRVLVPAVPDASSRTRDGSASVGEAVSLGGLLALGTFPQAHFPRLNITFVAHATETGEPLADGTRYLDSELIEGSIPVMLEAAEVALRRNMRRRGVVAGLSREDRWDYPAEAIREVVVNALMHRDYHSSTHGQPVMLTLFPDRLEITSPGGLYGPIDPQALLVKPVTSSRNARLGRLLQDIPLRGTNRPISESVGTGLQVVAASLRREGMAPPQLSHSLSEFRVAMQVGTLLDDPTVDWMRSIGAANLHQRQQLGLAHVRRHGAIDNRTYCALTGCEPATASVELAELRRREIIERLGSRRWATWQLAQRLDDAAPDARSWSRLIQPEMQFDPSQHAETASIEGVSASATAADGAPTTATLSTRERQVLDELADGPLAARELADRLGVTPNGARNWLRSLEAAGMVQPTEPGRRSRFQCWRRVDKP